MPDALASTDRLLRFRLGEQALSMAARQVREILVAPRLARVPHGPAALLGLAAVRGEAVPVLSLAALMGRSEAAIEKIILADIDGPVGIAVSGVSHIGENSQSDVVPRIDIAALIAAAMPERRAPRRSAELGLGLVPAQPLETQGETLPLIAFTTGGQEFALPLASVEDVLRLPDQLTRLPHSENATIGTIPWRGSVLPLLSLTGLLGMAVAVPARQARVVVTRVAGHALGLVVDAIRSVERVAEHSIDPVSSLLNRGGEARVQAICRLDEGQRLLAILSPDQLVRDDLAMAMAPDLSREHQTMRAGESAGENDMLETFLIFTIEGAPFALPITAVRQVARLPERLAQLPRAPEFLRGLMPVTGEVVPVIDLASRFDRSAGHGDDGKAAKPKVIVVETGDLTAGFIVDTVDAIRRLPGSALRAAPDLGIEGMRVFDRVVEGDEPGALVLIVSPQDLLDQAERDLLRDLSREAAKTAP